MIFCFCVSENRSLFWAENYPIWPFCCEEFKNFYVLQKGEQAWKLNDRRPSKVRYFERGSQLNIMLDKLAKSPQNLRTKFKTYRPVFWFLPHVMLFLSPTWGQQTYFIITQKKTRLVINSQSTISIFINSTFQFCLFIITIIN